MQKLSMSIAKGKGNQKHNTREQELSPLNVDPSRTKNNVILIHDNIQEAYHHLFDTALEHYNAKQKRNDRKIKDYYRHINNSKKEKTFHELVVQIGDKDRHLDSSISVSIYKEFIEEFKKSNPQMHVFGAYIHLDEATPHLHLDYIPYTTGAKRGLEKKISNDGAIRQQGYKSWDSWKDAQFKALEYIAEKYNISREYQYNTERHRTVAGYKKEQEIIETRIKHLENEINQSDVSPKKSILGKETVDYEKYKTLERAYKLQKAQISTLRDENKKLEENYLEIKNKCYIKENAALKEELRKTKQENYHLIKNKEVLTKANQELKSIENEYSRFRDFIFTILKKLHLTKFYEKLIEKKYLENILPEDVDDREYLNELNKAKESLEKTGKRRRYYRRDEHDIEL